YDRVAAGGVAVGRRQALVGIELHPWSNVVRADQRMPNPAKTEGVAAAKQFVMGKNRNLDLRSRTLAGVACVRAVGGGVEIGRVDEAKDRAITDLAGIEVPIRSHRSSVRDLRNRAPGFGVLQLRTAAECVPAGLRSDHAGNVNQISHALAVVAVRVVDDARDSCAYTAIVG